MNTQRSVRVEPGQRFNRWTVLREVDRRRGERRVGCRCDCGTERVANLYQVVSGASKGCSKCASTHPMLPVGHRCHDLTVLALIPSRRSDGKRRRYLCRCACGHEFDLLGQSLDPDSSRSTHSCHECSKRKKRKFESVDGINGTRWNCLLANAKTRGIPVEITIEDAAALFRAVGHGSW